MRMVVASCQHKASEGRARFPGRNTQRRKETMKKISRKSFLKLAGATAAGGVLVPTLSA